MSTGCADNFGSGVGGRACLHVFHLLLGVSQKDFSLTLCSGIEIWRIENSQPVLLPKPDYGRFYSADSYIVLKTAGKAGAYTYDIHFWLGKDTGQDEAGTAAMKAVELDAVLGSRAIQYREIQCHESSRFLSYFKPCMMPLEGGFSSGFKTSADETFETLLYTCEGKRAIRLKQVPFMRSSLNHDEIFILVTKEKMFQFNGANTNVQERSKALDVVQLLKEKYHEGTCNVAIIEDGKLQTEGNSAEFWNLFDGYAPIGKKVASEDDTIPEKTPAKLYWISGGQLQEVVGELSKSSLRTDRCYLLYCGTDVFTWVGRATRLEDKRAAMQAAEEFNLKENIPKSTRVTRLIQGHETSSFKSNFVTWSSASAAPPFEEGRGRVAAMLKQQGGVFKAQTKSSPVEEEVPPLLADNGNLEVWRIDGDAKTSIPIEDTGKFYSGDCYICLYSYHSNDQKEEHYLCCWIGKESIEADQQMAFQMATSMFSSLKCKPVQGRIYQGKEPPQFVALYHPMVVLKGGLSSGYKSYIADKELNDETYSPDTSALIEISGTSVHNNKALQVDLAATSLNSYGCFIQQSNSAVCIWSGNQSTVEKNKLAVKVAEFLKGGVTIKYAKEGKESLAFWLALGGKQSYTSNKVTQEIVREPHLFAISSNKGKFEIEEVYSFEQDDLLTEDVMILDTHAEVAVWVGQSVDPKEKQKAFGTGQKYVDLAASTDGLSPYVPLYKVPEGSEPCFFTTYFSWDPSKISAQATSFKKKAVLLFGPGCITESQDNKPRVSLSGATQRASAMAALTSAFKSSNVTKTPVAPRMPSHGSQRAAAVAALSTVLTAEKKGPPDSPPRRHHRRNTSTESISPGIGGGPGSPRFSTGAASPGFGGGAASPGVSGGAASPGISGGAVSPGITGGSSISDEAPVQTEEPSNVSEQNEGSEATNETETSEPTLETNEQESSTKETDETEKDCENSQSSYTYEQLKAKSTNPVTGIDYKKREAYLSDEEFEDVFNMTKEAFYKLPRWKQDQLKRKVDLF
uniref:villin-2-like n=1 Tax=Erigeron canadensis TaxID=72917 RepID=UPI001CB93157|nr:villin-2-like [Erigeron canadensis]